MIASKQSRKPDKCRVPDREAETYRLDEEDMDNLIALMEEANGILDFYHGMPQNLTGILATALAGRYETLVDLAESFRDALYFVCEHMERWHEALTMATWSAEDYEKGEWVRVDDGSYPVDCLDSAEYSFYPFVRYLNPVA